MATRKVSGGKRIDTWSWTIDGHEIKAEVYMTQVKESYDPDNYPRGATVFHGLCEAVDAHLRNTDINLLKEALGKTIKDRIHVEWMPMLVVTLTGDRPPNETKWNHDADVGIVPRIAADVFAPGYRRPADVSTRPFFNQTAEAAAKMKMHVKAIDIATVLGEKKHRVRQKDTSYRYSIDNGWPETGDFTATTASHGRERGTVAMIPDTLENRAALMKVRVAMEDLVTKLDNLLHPDRIERTLMMANFPFLLAPDAAEPKKRR